MGGIGSVVAIIFGIFWTIMAAAMTKNAPFGGISLFPLFGVLFILVGVANAFYNFRNATAKKRYSVVDITDSESEPDPLNEQFGNAQDDAKDASEPDRAPGSTPKFCPYCGKGLDRDFRYCPSCGKELPR
jgi:hypothetical protein